MWLARSARTKSGLLRGSECGRLRPGERPTSPDVGAGASQPVQTARPSQASSQRHRLERGLSRSPPGTVRSRRSPSLKRRLVSSIGSPPRRRRIGRSDCVFAGPSGVRNRPRASPQDAIGGQRCAPDTQGRFRLVGAWYALEANTVYFHGATHPRLRSTRQSDARARAFYRCRHRPPPEHCRRVRSPLRVVRRSGYPEYE